MEEPGGARRPPAALAADGSDANARRWAALPFLLTGYLLVFAAVTMVNVALPSAQEDLGLSDSGRQWLLTGYSLAFGGLMLLGGRLGDVLGLRRVITLGLVGFAAASLLGGLATSGGVLLAARALQGVAGALVAPAGLALLSVMFPAGEARAQAFGVLGTVMGIGTAGSFVVAGWLTDVLDWRWTLLVNVPLALIAAAGLVRTAPRSAPSGRTRVDLASAATITAALVAFVLAFDRASREGWTAPSTAVLLVLGVVLLASFVLVARRVPSPLLPLTVLADRTRGAAFGAVFVLAIGMFAGMYILTVYLQDVLGYSALRTGFAFVPFGVTAMAASRVLATGRIPTVIALGAGLSSIASGLVLLTLASTTSDYATGVLPTMMLLGVGATTVMVTASNVATLHAGSAGGVASAAVGATQQVGAALGTALLGSIAASATRDRAGGTRMEVSEATWIDALVHGFTRSAGVGALLVAIGVVAVTAVLAGRSHQLDAPGRRSAGRGGRPALTGRRRDPR